MEGLMIAMTSSEADAILDAALGRLIDANAATHSMIPSRKPGTV
jgi:hypothetical protein